MKKLILMAVALLVLYLASDAIYPRWNGVCYSQYSGLNASTPRYDGRHVYEPKQSGCKYSPDSDIRAILDKF